MSQLRELTIGETGKLLADEHMRSDPSVRKVYRIDHATEVRLIEVTDSVPATGEILPFRFSTDPPEVLFRSLVVLLHPTDWDRRSELAWPLELDPQANVLELIAEAPAERRGIAEAVAYAQENLSAFFELCVSELLTHEASLTRSQLEPGLSVLKTRLLERGADIARSTRMKLLTKLAEQFQQISKDTGDTGLARAADILRHEARAELTKFQSLIDKIKSAPETNS